MSRSDITKKLVWISTTGCYFIASILNIIILKKELQKRKQHDIIFVSKYMKIFPLLSIINGVLVTVFGFVQFFPIMCHFAWVILAITLTSQCLFLGYYQLSRLFYCFANSKVHSNYGYSNTVFIIMCSVSIIFIINTLFMAFIDGIRLQCFINNEYDFIEYYGYTNLNITASYPYRKALNFIFYTIWDLFTLMLYIVKLKTFTKKMKMKKEANAINEINENVYKRIKYILNRIILLTIFYEIPCFIYFLRVMVPINSDIFIIFGNFVVISGYVLMNYSVFLMQQHNSAEYDHFLKMLNAFRIWYICCCCKVLIMDSLEYEANELVLANVKSQSNVVDDTINTDSNVVEPQIKTLEPSVFEDI